MEGAKSYEGEKVWSSINHSILSGLPESISLRVVMSPKDNAAAELFYPVPILGSGLRPQCP